MQWNGSSQSGKRGGFRWHCGRHPYLKSAMYPSCERGHQRRRVLILASLGPSTTSRLFVPKYARSLLQPPRGGFREASRQRRVAVSCMCTACERTHVLFFSSFIDTVLMSGFSYLKKRHPVGQRRVAVLRGEIVPVSPDVRVSITQSVLINWSIVALIGHRRIQPRRDLRNNPCANHRGYR